MLCGKAFSYTANDFDFFSQKQSVIEEIANIERRFVFHELVSGSVWKLLDSHSKELTDDAERAFEEADNDFEVDNVQMKEFTLKEFEDIFLERKYYREISLLSIVCNVNGRVVIEKN